MAHLPDPQKNSLSIATALIIGRKRLIPTSSSAALDIQVLLAHILQSDRGHLLAHPEIQLDSSQMQALDEALLQIESGTPLPYILGKWEFYGLSIALTPDVLIPRPESELIVETALQWLGENSDRLRCAEVGTGSACISIAIAMHAPKIQIIAGDISAKALKVAEGNIRDYALQDRVHLVNSHLLDAMRAPFDLIVANLPYIPSRRLTRLSVSDKEPLIALDGGRDGLKLIKLFLAQSAKKLAASGLLLAEIDESHADKSKKLAVSYFPKAEVRIKSDLSGLPRLLQIIS